jgi:hypothetical protein
MGIVSRGSHSRLIVLPIQVRCITGAGLAMAPSACGMKRAATLSHFPKSKPVRVYLPMHRQLGEASLQLDSELGLFGVCSTSVWDNRSRLLQ